MRRSVWWALVVGCLGFFGTARIAGALIFPFFSNQLSVYAINGSLRAGVHPPDRATLGELPRPVWLITNWDLSADLRDASCPTCQFPAFAWPKTFDCLGDCTDGHWRLSNRVASVEMIPQAIPVTPTLFAPAIRLEQDTLGGRASCSQEYNLWTSQPQSGKLQSNDLSANYVLGFWQEIEEVTQGTNCPGDQNVASTVVGVQLFNLQSQPTHLLNYQIVTFDSRGVHFKGSYWSFVNTEGVTVYGVNDSLRVLGEVPLRPGKPGRYVIVEIGEQLRQAVLDNPFGLDKDWRQWYISGVYAGSYTNGEARIKSLQGRFEFN